MWHSGGGATIAQPAQRTQEQVHEQGEKSPYANTDIGGPAGALVLRVRALMWIITKIVGMIGRAGITSG